MAHKRLRVWMAILLFLCSASIGAPQQEINAPSFAGQYSELLGQQKRLVDDWFQRFSETIQKPVDAAEGYNNLPLSAKTPFNAVTHALLKTPC